MRYALRQWPEKKIPAADGRQNAVVTTSDTFVFYILYFIYYSPLYCLHINVYGKQCFCHPLVMNSILSYCFLPLSDVFVRPVGFTKCRKPVRQECVTSIYNFWHHDLWRKLPEDIWVDGRSNLSFKTLAFYIMCFTSWPNIFIDFRVFSLLFVTVISISI